MNTPTVFTFNTSDVRTKIICGDAWFAANDVAYALGYKRCKQAITQHCKGDVKRVPLQTGGGMQTVRVINEPDLYRLIFGSKLKAAVKFQDWVFEEVIPQIRKTGQYTLPAGLTPEQQRLAQNAVAKLHGATGETFQAIWSSVKDQFKVGTYKDIPTGQFDELMLFLKSPPKPKAMPHMVGEMHSNDYCAAWLDVGKVRLNRLRLVRENIYEMPFCDLRTQIDRSYAELYDSIIEAGSRIKRINKNQIEAKTKRLLGNHRMGA